MLLVLVENQLFQLPDSLVTESVTLSNLINLTNISNQETPLSLGISLPLFLKYLKFVEDGKFSHDALSIIDYLENYKQFKSWVLLAIDNGYSFEQLENILKYTAFLNFDPLFLLTTTIEQIIPYLECFSSSQGLPQKYISHIVQILYPDKENLFPLFLRKEQVDRSIFIGHGNIMKYKEIGSIIYKPADWRGWESAIHYDPFTVFPRITHSQSVRYQQPQGP